MSKKLKTVIKQGDKNPQQNQGETRTANSPARHETENQEKIEGSELFSLFTANIIKEGKVFTR